VTDNEDIRHGHDGNTPHDNGDASHGNGNATAFKVTVVYNGMTRPFEVRGRDSVKSLLDRAIAAFGNLPSPHTLSLFSASGAELSDTLTLSAAGVRPRDQLLLRPSTVKGGC